MSPRDTESSRNQLPIELIFHIIAFLDDRGDSDTDTFSLEGVSPCLTACSLVCHAWNAICRPRIFCKVVIYDIERLSLRLSFLHFIAPHLCKYVLDLRLRLDGDDVDSASALASWGPDCFKRFNNLRALYLKGMGMVMSTALDVDLTPLLAAPRLRKLHIEDWSFAEDASDLLNILLSTNPQLEELTLKDIFSEFVDEDTAEAPSAVRFEALRRMEICKVAHPMLRLDVLIESPNLNSLVAQWYYPLHWNVPPWVSTSFSELELTVNTSLGLPDFGKVIQPSTLTINISGNDPIIELTTWIKDCINLLPFPNLLHRLTINTGINDINERERETFYHELEDLSRFLHQLCDVGALEGIVLRIELFVNWIQTIGDVNDVLDPSDEAQARELAKLENGVGVLLERNGLELDVVLEWSSGWNSEHGQPVFYTRVQRVAKQ